jgi:hypothetical protein
MSFIEIIFISVGSIICFHGGKFAYSKDSIFKSKVGRFLLGIIINPLIFFFLLGIDFDRVGYYYAPFVISSIIGAISQNSKNKDQE